MSFPVDNTAGNNNANTMASDPRLIYYDIAFAVPREKNTAAPNPWKARYALNFKGVPYKTEWVQMLDITKVRKGLGASACRKFADGADYYTLPVLKDSTTGAIVGDSFDIALYLQETFPDSGSGDLFPEQPDLNYVCPGAEEVLIPLSKREDVQHKDYSKFNTNVDWAFTLHTALMASGMKWDKEFEQGIKDEFVRRLGAKSWEDMGVYGEKRVHMLESLKQTLTGLAELYKRNENGPFLLGDRASHADFIVGGWLRFMERTLPADEWKQAEGWHDGVFGKLHAALQERFRDVK
ncbi:hypothetical protein QC762_310450 [Podospora pseudocomata]|uniref:GST N-terminal domain-containing protein n=1 Tax=Podospora pseudocomata TaxID=2093779 RepID=A0ABR0GKS6_9PEZI|nr:hypothetical protein QC762_310450 [Podospora pseudocomata]